MGGLSVGNGSDLIATLLILVLGMALGVGLICLLLVVHFLRAGHNVSQRGTRHTEPWPRDRKLPAPFHTTPCRWLAIKSGNPRLVQTALGLRKATACSWEEGLHAAHEQKLFISPPVNGWIFVMGASLPDPGEDVDKCFCFLLDLSRKLGQVQFFSFNRVVNHHAWVHAEEGRIQRAYAWAGKTLWNQGRLTKAEMDLDLKCWDYTTPAIPVDYGRTDPNCANTEKVPLLAARWSVDPTAVDARMLKEAQGISGQISRTKTH